MALQLYERGIRGVRPLKGGIEAWRRGELPLEAVVTKPAPAAGPVAPTT